MNSGEKRGVQTGRIRALRSPDAPKVFPAFDPRKENRLQRSNLFSYLFFSVIWRDESVARIWRRHKKVSLPFSALKGCGVHKRKSLSFSRM